MAATDAINNASRILQVLFRKQDKDLHDTFRQQNVLMDRVTSTETGLAERVIEGHLLRESMGTWTPITVPGARYNWQTRGQTATFSVGLGRGVITFLVPITEFRAIGGSPENSQKVINFYESNIKGTIRRYNFERSQHVLTGSVNSPVVATSANGYSPFASFSPDFSTGTTTGADNGLFSAAAVDSQSTVTLNLAKSSAYDWVTQYRDIASSFAVNGPRQWNGIMGDAREYSDDPSGQGTEYVGICDSASWENMTSYYIGRGTLFMSPPQANAAADMGQQGALMPNNVRLYKTIQLRTANFSTAALTNGVTYLINPGPQYLKHFVSPDVKSMWSNVVWEKDPLSDNMRAIVEVDEQLTLWGNLAVHGLLSGTAR